MNKQKMAVVVLSCDKYQDLWPPFFELFFRNWPSCPFEVLLFSNETKSPDPRVKTIQSGPDRDWSSSVKSCLMQIDYEYVLILFDDVFFLNPVNQSSLDKLFSYIDQFKPDYQKFTPVPKPDIQLNEDIGKYKTTTHYRNGLMSIWKRETLMSMIVEGESAWNFEMRGLERSQKYENFFGCYKEYFKFLHGVEKGMWYKKAIQVLKAHNIQVDTQARGVLDGKNHFKSQLSLFRRYIFLKTPASMRPLLFKASALVREKLYKKW